MNDVQEDGVWYHTDEDGNFLFWENGDRIESITCLCYAFSASECTCGAWGIEVLDGTP